MLVLLCTFYLISTKSYICPATGNLILCLHNYYLLKNANAFERTRLHDRSLDMSTVIFTFLKVPTFENSSQPSLVMRMRILYSVSVRVSNRMSWLDGIQLLKELLLTSHNMILALLSMLSSNCQHGIASDKYFFLHKLFFLDFIGC